MVAMQGKSVKGQWFFQDIDQLAKSLLLADQQGYTVYHACASFTDNQSRKQANVDKVKSLWLDIDAGKGKPYADAREAGGAVIQFCKAASLPAPLFVGSGGGVHVYWPLEQEIDVSTWQAIATRLKAACVRHGLKADATRTADAASILRPVGTRNFKYEPPRLVAMGPVPDSYPLSTFDHLEGAAPKAAAKPTGLLAAAMVTKTYAASDVVEATSQCAQLAYVREHKGNVEEPLWYAALGAWVFCTDGENAAHVYSSGHPNYSREETDKKLAQSKSLSGPTTCAHFQSLNPTGCEGCPFAGKIITPVQLGEPKPAPKTQGKEATVSNTLPELPDGFGWGDHGELLMLTESGKGREIATIISSYSLWLSSVHKSESAEDGNLFVFRSYKPYEGWRNIIVPAKKVFGQSTVADMADRDVLIEDLASFRIYCTAAANILAKQGAREMFYDQFGWKPGGVFLVGKNLYGPNGIAQVSGGQEMERRSKGLGQSRSGDIHLWSAAVEQMISVEGAQGQGFAIICSLAAPFMRFHGENEGGTILSLVTEESARGKSTALYGAASVWGSYASLDMTARDTMVSKGISLGTLGNLPVMFDEVASQQREVATDFVDMFTAGRDKQRGTMDGGVKQSASRWQTVCMTASNKSLVELLTAEKENDALAYRVMELPLNIPRNVGSSAGDKLRRTFEQCYGFAGHDMMSYLTYPGVLNPVLEVLQKNTEHMERACKFRTEHRFWTRLLGSALTAAQIVEKRDMIHGLGKLFRYHIEWAARHMMDTLKEETVSKGEPHQRALALVSRWFYEHTSEIVVYPPTGSQHLKSVKGRYDRQKNRLYIHAAAFRKWLVENGRNPREITAHLAKHRLALSMGRTISLGYGTGLGIGAVACIEIDTNHPSMREVEESITVDENRVVAFPSR